MTPITEQNNLGDLLKYEAPNRYSRDVATIAAGQNLPLGTVLGRNASDGKHYAIDPAANDGTESPCGVGKRSMPPMPTAATHPVARHAIVPKPRWSGRSRSPAPSARLTSSSWPSAVCGA